MLSGRSKCNIPGNLYFIFCFTGLILKSRKYNWYRVTSGIFIIILMYVNVDNWIFTFLYHYHTKRAFVAYIIPYWLTAWMWYAAYLKRKKLTMLLKMFQRFKSDEKIVSILPFIFGCLTMVNSLLITTKTHEFNPTFYTYGYDTGFSWVQTVIAFIKVCLFGSVFPTYANMVTLLYCILCFRCSKMLNKLSQEVTECPLELFTPSKRFEVIKEKSKIDEILSLIQDIFSLPTFAIVVANLFMCFSILSIYLDSRIEEDEMGIKVFLLNASNSFGCLVFILWMAGKVNIEDQIFKEAFHTKVKQRMIVVKTHEKFQSEKLLLAKPDFVFTGWNVFSYRRNSIFVLVGTLLTYTVLFDSK
ncbi:hypothetical protein AVEN_147356-1 [Araneus ventricosus]|uniref:Gustatory receptor n=1 Tax=Araneus ventricosus TaxID=182803 RepID=A0A4Y2T1J3_ARAVE|nr:hypothetical protein AVEN_147356-1 [Araneus ventricosus]